MILAAVIAASTPAVVQADSDLPSATVAIGDLDLSTDADQAKLRARLASEIGRMCRVEGPVDARMSRLRTDCIATARANADTGFARAVANARRTELASR